MSAQYTSKHPARYVVNLNFTCDEDTRSLRDAIVQAKDHAQVLPHERDERLRIVAVFLNGETVQFGEDA
jgi:hypothetical protein